MANTSWLQKLKNLIGTPAASVSADIAAIKGETAGIAAIPTTAQRGTDSAMLAANGALEATLTAIKGATWGAGDTLEAIVDAIALLSTAGTYLEQIPDTDISLAAIDATLTADPPSADAANKVVDIDVSSGKTYVLRSLLINITSLGAASKLTFKLWTMLGTAVTQVDSVDVSATGIQNLFDLFGVQEVFGDGIWVTVQSDTGSDAALVGTYKYAQAST